MAIVLVTGASGGIGSAICRVLARRGATLALHYQADPDGAEQARRSLEGSGHVLVQADLAAPASIEQLWREVARLGPVDALINNAGIFPDHPPLASSYEEWTRAWERTLAVSRNSCHFACGRFERGFAACAGVEKGQYLPLARKFHW